MQIPAKRQFLRIKINIVTKARVLSVNILKRSYMALKDFLTKILLGSDIYEDLEMAEKVKCETHISGDCP